MRNKIFMYLFFFVLLLVIFQYMNQKAIFENKEEKINALTEKVTKASDSIAVLQDRVSDLNYFTLQGNDNSMTYLENLGMEAPEVEEMITNTIYDQNTGPEGNPLVPFTADNPMRINKIKFLNHRWILADFTDGSTWGEMVLEYFFDENNELSLTPVGSVLYPN